LHEVQKRESLFKSVEGISRRCSSAEKPVVKQEGFDEAKVAREEEEELMIKDNILGELMMSRTKEAQGGDAGALYVSRKRDEENEVERWRSKIKKQAISERAQITSEDTKQRFGDGEHYVFPEHVARRSLARAILSKGNQEKIKVKLTI